MQIFGLVDKIYNSRNNVTQLTNTAGQKLYIIKKREEVSSAPIFPMYVQYISSHDKTLLGIHYITSKHCSIYVCCVVTYFYLTPGWVSVYCKVTLAPLV